MPYLRRYDYEVSIQDKNLTQILSKNDNLRLLSESRAQERCISNLVQKYNTPQEFTNTNIYNQSIIYYAGNRSYLDFPAYIPTQATYNVGDLYSNNGLQYMNKTAITVAEAFTPSKWFQLGAQYDIWNVQFPAPLFDINGNYKVGSVVWWAGKLYIAKQPTPGQNYQAYLGAMVYSNVPFPNYLPDDPINGFNQWGTGIPYSTIGVAPGAPASAYTTWDGVTTFPLNKVVNYNGVIYISAIANNLNNTPGTDLTKWLPVVWLFGDNRCQDLMGAMIELSLFFIHKRIAPENIPDVRYASYKEAMKWLSDACKGELSPQGLMLLMPRQGTRIDFGGNVKVQNNY